MELTAKQQEGLDLAIKRYRAGERYTIISGYAGSGKSTLVRFIVSALANCGVNPKEDICYCAFTGKAAQVLTNKGNKPSMTLHKLLYDSYPRKDGTFVRVPKPELDYRVIVIDEISMAPKTLIDLLFRHQCYVIGLGDPFQLPPINKNEDNGLLEHPHVFLDQIMRQAAESEIIQLTMKIRNGESIDEFKGKEVQILSENELNTGMLTWADQILCATNKTRIAINTQMRELTGHHSLEPEDGDKVICLRNYWETYSISQNDALTNGTIGFLKNPYSTFFRIPTYMGGGQVFTLGSDFVTDTGEIFEDLSMDKEMIKTGQSPLSKSLKYRLSRNAKTRDLVPLEFTYGYAITTHKSQGSEWDAVLVLEEGFPYSAHEHARWLYTACTRAASKLVLIR